MPGFQDAPLVGPGFELQLTLEGARLHEDVIAEALPATVVEPEAVASFSVVELGEEAEALELDLALARVCAREENLYVAGERLAARAASPATRKQYASIYRTFGDWLRAELDRPPTTSDLTRDAIGAFGRHLEVTGGAWGRSRVNGHAPGVPEHGPRPGPRPRPRAGGRPGARPPPPRLPALRPVGMSVTRRSSSPPQVTEGTALISAALRGGRPVRGRGRGP